MAFSPPSRAGRTIGWVGIGNLGAPCLERVVAQGHDVRVAIRRPEKRSEWAQRGVTVVPDAAQAAEGAAMLVIYVFSEEQVVEVVESALGHLAPGAIVVLHTVVTTATLGWLHDRLTARGVLLADAQVDGSAQHAAEGHLALLLGADHDVAGHVRSLVEAYADPVLHVGAVGAGTKIKLINNIGFAAHLQVAGALVELGEGFGLDRPSLLTALTQLSSHSEALGYLHSVGGDIDLLVSYVRPYARKDVPACLSSAEAVGVSPDLLADIVVRGPASILD